MSAPTNFQVTGYNSFWKILSFHFFLWKSPNYKIWPCRKIGQGQPRVIICTNYDGLESPMLHTKFCGNQPAGSGEEDFWRGFTTYGRGGHLGHVTRMPATNFCSPYPMRLNINMALIGQSVSEEKMFEIVNDNRRWTTKRTMDGRRTISSPMSLRLRWAKN